MPGSSESVGAGIDALSESLLDIANLYLKGKSINQQQEQFDATFSQNEKQFGLNFALKEFATRKGLKLQEAQQLYNQKIGSQRIGMERATTRERLKGAGQQRLQTAEQFSWLREDREKKQKQDSFFSKGVLKGLLGGK